MGRTCGPYAATNPYTCSGGNCVGGTYYYTCNCSTCYPYYVRILQSVASTVSTITTWTLSTLANSLRIKTSGTQITAQAFSDTALATQIGSDLVYTATGAAITSTYGITLYTSASSQGYTVGTTDITYN
jgi:hypothetical protein